MPGISRSYRHLIGPALLMLIIGGSFWKVALSHREYTWLESPDLVNQVLPWLQFEAGEFHRGHFPLWDPYEWGGQSLIGQAQPAIAYPVNWLLYALPLKNGWIQQVYLDLFFIAIHYIAGLFCYWLCRDLGRSRPASLLAASAFALSGWMGNTDWPQMLNGGVWAPLIFLFFFRMMRGENPVRSAGLSGAMLGIAFLSGHHQIPIFTSLAIGGAWIYWLATRYRGRASMLSTLACVASFAVMFGLLGAFQTLPAIEYGKQAVRWVGANNTMGWKDVVPYRVHSFFSLPPASILGLVIMPASDHTTPFAGFTVLAMAISGVAAGWRNSTVRVIGCVTLGGFLLSMGQWNIFHGLIYAIVPQVEKARNVAFGIFVFGFGVSVLSAFGLDLFLQNTAIWQRVVARAVSICGLVITASTFFLMQTTLPKSADYNMIMVCGLMAILTGVALLCWTKGILRHGATVMLMVALLEFGTSLGWGYHPSGEPQSMVKKMSVHSEIASWLRRQPGPVRVEMDENEITYNFGDWYGIEVYGGYLASLTTNIGGTAGNNNARALMGVKYDVSRKPLHPDQEVEVFQDRNGMKIWQHTNVFPRVWSVHATKTVPPSQVEAAYDAGPERLRNEAFFVAEKGDPPAPAVDSCTGDSVNLVKRDANTVEIDAWMRCKGVVIAAETYDRGWRATVDGHSVPVMQAYGSARGVVVPQGHHQIAMNFYSRSILMGAVMTGIGFLTALGMLIL